MTTTKGPYTVTLTKEAPIQTTQGLDPVLGPTAIVTGPGNYRSEHGGGRDAEKHASMQACELNRAYWLGFEAGKNERTAV